MSFKRGLSALMSAALMLATVVMPVAPAVGGPAEVEVPYAFVRHFPEPLPARHFVQPVDVAVTYDHDVLVVDKYYKKVLRYNAVGQYLASYAIAPAGLPAIDIPRRVAAAADGSFYVFVEDRNGLDVGDFKIVHCAADGTALAAFSGRGTADGQFSGHEDLDMAVESNGNLVVLDKTGGRVVRFSPTGAFLGTLGSPGTGPGQLSSPVALTVDDEGTVWVAGSRAGGGRLQGYRSNGTSGSIDTTYAGTAVAAHGGYVYYNDPFGRISCVTSGGAWVSSTNSAGGYGIPVTAMSVDPVIGSGTLYACGGEGWNAGPPLAQVAVLAAPALTTVTTWRSWRIGDEYLAAPLDVAAATTTVLVSDPNESTLKQYTSSGLYLGSWGGTGSGNGEFLSIGAVAIDAAGYTYVVDNANGRIEGFDESMAFDGRRTLPSTATVSDIDIYDDNIIYAADPDDGLIRVFDGTVQTSEWGVEGNGAGRLNSPGSIALTRDGHIWVSDCYRVAKFTVDGVYTGISVCEHDNSSVWPIAVDAEGRLVVRDENNRLLRFHSDGKGVVEMGGLGFGEAQFANPLGMDFAPGGHLYVADTYNDRIQELSPGTDTQPPLTTREGWETWVPWEVNVGLNAVDGCAGVAQTRYSLSGATTRAEGPYTGEFPVTAEGTTTITFYSIDASGHAESPKTSYAKRDYTWPLVTPSVGEWQVVNATSTVVTLTANDAMSGVDWIEWKLDGGPVTRVSGAVAQIPVTGDGYHTIYYKTSDKCGNVWPAFDDVMFELNVPTTNRPPATPATSGEVAGTDRFATGVQISKSAYPGGAGTVVLASGRNFPDALGAAALAGSYDAPLLLVEPTSLPAAVKDEITRLRASKVIVIGGPPAVSDSVMSEAKALLTGTKDASRVSGPDRYATSKAVYDAFKSRLAATGRVFSGTVIVASGANFPDALAASPLSAHKAWPILLTQPTAVPGPTLAAIKDGTVKNAIVVGGPPAVSDGVMAGLKTQLGAANVTRLSGPDRYTTALAIIARAESEGLNWDGVCVATGTNFADALAGGPYAAKAGTFVALTPPTALDANLRNTLVAKKAQIGSVRFLGSTAAVTQPVRTAIMDALNK